MEAPFKAVALAMQIEKVSNNCCTPIQFKYLWQQSFRSLYIATILLASISHYLLDSSILQQLFCVVKGKYISNLLFNSLSAFPQLCSYKRSCQRCFAFQALYKFCRVLNAERNLSLNLKYIYGLVCRTMQQYLDMYTLSISRPNHFCFSFPLATIKIIFILLDIKTVDTFWFLRFSGTTLCVSKDIKMYRVCNFNIGSDCCNSKVYLYLSEFILIQRKIPWN